MVASSHLVPGVLLCKEGELAHPPLTNTTMHLAKCVPLVETNGRGRYFRLGEKMGSKWMSACVGTQQFEGRGPCFTKMKRDILSLIVLGQNS